MGLAQEVVGQGLWASYHLWDTVYFKMSRYQVSSLHDPLCVLSHMNGQLRIKELA